MQIKGLEQSVMNVGHSSAVWWRIVAPVADSKWTQGEQNDFNVSVKIFSQTSVPEQKEYTLVYSFWSSVVFGMKMWRAPEATSGPVGAKQNFTFWYCPNHSLVILIYISMDLFSNKDLLASENVWKTETNLFSEDWNFWNEQNIYSFKKRRENDM